SARPFPYTTLFRSQRPAVPERTAGVISGRLSGYFPDAAVTIQQRGKVLFLPVNGAFFYFFAERAQQPVEVALLPAVAALCMAFIKINQPHAAIGIEQNIVNIQIGMVHLSLVQTGYFDADMTVLFGIQRALLQQLGQIAGGGYFGGNQVGAVTQAAFDRPRRQWPGHIHTSGAQALQQSKFLLAAGVVPAAEPIAIAHQFAEQTTAAVMAQRRLTGITGNKPGGTAATGLAADA